MNKAREIVFMATRSAVYICLKILTPEPHIRSNSKNQWLEPKSLTIYMNFLKLKCGYSRSVVWSVR